MFIAKVIDNKVVIGDYRELFPNTSFPLSGPNDDFYADMGAYKIKHDKPYNGSEMLVQCEPYVEGEFVYTVRVEAKPEQQEIQPEQQETIIIDSGNGSDSI
jgi:hypothetical protein